MTTYDISPNSAGVAIEIAGIGERQEQVLAAFSECRQGRCSCPTDEYQKVESMDVVPGEGEISIQLRAKAGTDFDVSQIRECVEHTVSQAADQANGEQGR